MKDDDQKVGYGKPPKHGRFKKGQSGNPKGRAPKTRNFDTLMERELDSMVTVKVGGVTMRLTKREAIIKTLINEAMRGIPRAFKCLVDYLRDSGVADPFGTTAEDKADLQKALLKMLTPRKKTNEGPA